MALFHAAQCPLAIDVLYEGCFVIARSGTTRQSGLLRYARNDRFLLTSW
jgi:hypothetical protein